MDHYVEYPFTPHPMVGLGKMLAEMGVTGGDFGADTDGYPWILGYRGPSLSELTGSRPRPVAGFIEDQMAIKSPAELRADPGERQMGTPGAHPAPALHPGRRHRDRGQLAGEHGSDPGDAGRHRPVVPGAECVLGGAQRRLSRADRPQRGHPARPGQQHHLSCRRRAGDGSRLPDVGLRIELERTMVIGPAGDEQRRMFDHMVALQDTAIEALKPGARCCDVDRAVRAYFEQHDLMKYWKHHSGHAIGLRYHEGPFLDLGDETELRPGMVMTVEPGLYVPGLGGFRHSDTVVVTEEGSEVLTYYPLRPGEPDAARVRRMCSVGRGLPTEAHPAAVRRPCRSSAVSSFSRVKCLSWARSPDRSPPGCGQETLPIKRSIVFFQSEMSQLGEVSRPKPARLRSGDLADQVRYRLFPEREVFLKKGERHVLHQPSTGTPSRPTPRPP